MFGNTYYFEKLMEFEQKEILKRNRENLRFLYARRSGSSPFKTPSVHVRMKKLSSQQECSC